MFAWKIIEVHECSLFASTGMIFSMTRFWPFGVRAMSPVPVDLISFVARRRDRPVARLLGVLFLACFEQFIFGQPMALRMVEK